MQDKLEKLKSELSSELSRIKSSENLYKLEVKYLGRKGKLTEVLRSIKNLDEKQKKEIGKLANEVKKELQTRFKEAKGIFTKSVRATDFIDVTLPGKNLPIGHEHPITQVINELEDLFTSLGFLILDGPELESDYYNFTALNIPPYHPARDIQDTFYINKKSRNGNYDLVMRTHTSPMQVRAMQKYGAPLRCVVPGRVFRCEATDACHEHTFDQMEGLMIDQDISVSNLIAVMKELINGIFKKEMEIRVRPGYFPFVEPGLELDIKCTICEGRGCPACKNSGWLELLPSGIVHPKVLEFGGIDSKKYTGFAFGLGLTRLTMMRYGIDDIRLFNSGDLRFLSQF